MSATVVTGASGHLGANLVRALLAAGRSVRAVVHEDARALNGLGVERVDADVLDPASLRRAFEGAGSVFHLAGKISLMGDRDGSVRRINVDGTRNVAEACLASGVRRMVHVASIHALADPGAHRTVDEGALLAEGRRNPADDRSKAEGLRFVESAAARGLDAVSLLPAAVIGPYDHKPSRTGRLLVALAKGRMPALVEGGYHWVDARDVAAAALAAETRGRSGARYLVTGPWRSASDLAAMVTACGGAKPPRLVLPLVVARAFAPFADAWGRLAGEEPLFTREAVRTLRGHRNVVWGRAADELGFRPRPLEATVADTLAWLRSAGRL